MQTELLSRLPRTDKYNPEHSARRQGAKRTALIASCTVGRQCQLARVLFRVWVWVNERAAACHTPRGRPHAQLNRAPCHHPTIPPPHHAAATAAQLSQPPCSTRRRSRPPQPPPAAMETLHSLASRPDSCSRELTPSPMRMWQKPTSCGGQAGAGGPPMWRLTAGRLWLRVCCCWPAKASS